MIFNDAIKYEGSMGGCVWGLDISISGISWGSCVITRHVAYTTLFGNPDNNADYYDYSYVTNMASLSGIETIDIGGACVTPSNTAFWNNGFQVNCRTSNSACVYSLSDPVNSQTIVSPLASPALAAGENWSSPEGSSDGSSCNNDASNRGTYNPLPWWGLKGDAYFYWNGTNRVLALDLYNSGWQSIFHGTTLAQCPFKESPPTYTIENQNVAGGTSVIGSLSGFTWVNGIYGGTVGSTVAPAGYSSGSIGAAIASGGSATLTPVTVSNRVAWICLPPTFLGPYYWGKEQCDGPSGEGLKAIPCLGQCFGSPRDGSVFEGSRASSRGPAMDPAAAARAAPYMARRIPGERGLGATIRRLFLEREIPSVVIAYEHIVGRRCGCPDPAAMLDRLFPYPS